LICWQDEDVKSQPLGDLPHRVFQLFASLLGLDFIGPQQRSCSDEAAHRDRDRHQTHDKIQFAMQNLSQNQPPDIHAETPVRQ
jgi:hypothetical protein